jgi:CBS-domain-containing membrane protein
MSSGLNKPSHKEKLISGLGGSISILITIWLTYSIEQSLHSQLLFVASMGATAVLLFANPHGPLSQPWNVIGGHVVSAFTGVSAFFLVDDPMIAGALAVGLAITAMYYLNCLHPPGGATALVAVLGGASSFGFLYILFPIALGATLMVLVAIAFNYPFPWRRYPSSLFANKNAPSTNNAQDQTHPNIIHADLVAALSQIDGFIDISEEDLLRIYELATKRSHPALLEEKTGKH